MLAVANKLPSVVMLIFVTSAVWAYYYYIEFILVEKILIAISLLQDIKFLSLVMQKAFI